MSAAYIGGARPDVLHCRHPAALPGEAVDGRTLPCARGLKCDDPRAGGTVAEPPTVEEGSQLFRTGWKRFGALDTTGLPGACNHRAYRSVVLVL
jgi:hypothetical protein